jgi:hypothetical protein
VVEVHLVEVRLVESQTELSRRSGAACEGSFGFLDAEFCMAGKDMGHSMMCMGAWGLDRFALTRANNGDKTP